MTNLHHLQRKLKSLKLGGILETLDGRLDQAQKEHLGFLDFLELLLEDEIQRRHTKRLANRVAKARFEEVKTLEEFDLSFNPKTPSQQIRDLATCAFLEQKASVLIYGPVGVGKTHLAQALGHQACRRGYTVLFSKTSRLLRDLGGGRADGTWEARLRRYLLPDLLILDDFAMKEFTAQQAEDLYELIDERSRRASFIVTSNRCPQDWYPLFPNPVLAESALDRLVNASHHLVLEGKSYRPRLRPGHQDPLAKEVKTM
jgi:DNA replication protein DnaC